MRAVDAQESRTGVARRPPLQQLSMPVTD